MKKSVKMKSIKMKKMLKSITLLSVRSAKKVNLKYLLLWVLISTMLVSCAWLKDLSEKEVEVKVKEVKLSSPKVTASAKELMRITDDPVAEFAPSLSGDGKQLLYSIRDDARSGRERWSIRLKRDVMLPGFTPLVGSRAISASWVNNGGDFLFVYFSSKQVLAQSSINRPGITYVGQNAYGSFDNNPKASPDGKKIVFTTSLEGGQKSICIVNSNGSGFTVLSGGSRPQWHPEKNLILYYKKSGDKNQLFELDLNTHQSTQITTGESNSEQPSYSPNGEYIVFVSDREDDIYENLYVMKSTGESVTQLTSGNSLETQPSWGIDGYIYFSSTAGARRPDKDKGKHKPNIDGDGTFVYPYADIWRVRPLLIDREKAIEKAIKEEEEESKKTTKKSKKKR